MPVITRTDFRFPGQQSVYHGKVRDVYIFEDQLLAIASDRISAFDVILPEAIPGKGQVLNQLAAYFLKATEDIAPNWLLAVPDPNASFGLRCKPFAIEMVVRGYLAGHAWRTYSSGLRELCGVKLPDGLRENDRLPQPIITPSTKAHEGHDEDISKAEILQRGLATAAEYAQLEDYALRLFERGTQLAAERGLILVDTKYEFGTYDGRILVIDEIHTPDSSRYFYAEGYAERQHNGQPQRQLSKEFVREWLIANGFQGKQGQQVPPMPPEWVQEIAGRYRELYQKVTGQVFEADTAADPLARIETNVNALLQTLPSL